MRLRLLALAPALAAVVADAAGAGGLAFYLLLAAVPAAATAGLEVVGEVVDRRCGPLRAALSAFTLALVVIAATTRTPLLALGCVVIFGLQELAVLLSRRPLRESEAAEAR